jgi:hypothetical protein
MTDTSDTDMPQAEPTPTDEAPVTSAPANGEADAAETEAAESAPAETPPDRLATNPKSPFFQPELLSRGIGIRFNGQEKHNVDEYCVSEGWVRLAVGKSLDRKGNAMTIKLNGTVEPYFRS